MGLLADIFSYGDGLKRKVNGLLQDPMGTASLGATRMAEDQNSLLALMDQAGYTPGSKSVLQRPQDQQQARNSLAEKAMQTYGGLLGATVWHGSPHKFDKFDSSKIGTGEGAQAYGHGLYLAESDTVARHYKTAGSDPSTFVPVRSIRDPAQMAATVLDRAGGDIRHATSVLTQNMQSGDITAGAALQLLKQRAALPESQYSGHMYKVDLPDEHIAKMLDYDNPVSEAMRKPLSDAAMKEFGSGVTGTSGEKLYKEIVFNFKQAGHPNPTQAATDWLTKQGVPGLRYLDGGSRGAGTGTSNYVVFPGNESLLQILERNGQPIK